MQRVAFVEELGYEREVELPVSIDDIKRRDELTATELGGAVDDILRTSVDVSIVQNASVACSGSYLTQQHDVTLRVR